MAVLLIEDEAPKRENISALLGKMGLMAGSVEARSVGSAIRELKRAKFRLVILDMSLPTFDIGAGESGGRPQGFGGVEVLRYMDRFKIRTPVIVVTAFEAFAQDGRELDLPSLERDLREQHPATFRDLVFYNSMYSTWKDDLQTKITEAILG
jgi:CheY-like chemotaxis protein